MKNYERRSNLLLTRGSGFIYWLGQFFVLFSTPFRPVLGPIQPPIKTVPGGLLSGANRKNNRLTTYFHLGASLRMSCAMQHLPPHIFTAWCLINHKDNFTFLPLHENSFSLCVNPSSGSMGVWLSCTGIIGLLGSDFGEALGGL